jgi:F-type H+-transporting ATPase subunit delta
MSSNKSFSTETSERYSRALYEVAKESGELEKIELNIETFKLTLKESLELKNFIYNPTHSIENQNKVMNILSNELKFTKNLKNFFLLLVKKRRIFFISKILDSFSKLCMKKKGELKASLI